MGDKFIEEFEVKFARFIGTKYGIATMNGTVALHLALKALGIEAGDEEGQELIPEDVDAHDLSSQVVVPDGDKGPPHPGSHQILGKKGHRYHHSHDYVVHTLLGVENQAP